MRIDRKRTPANERPPIGFAIYKVTMKMLFNESNCVLFNQHFVSVSRGLRSLSKCLHFVMLQWAREKRNVRTAWLNMVEPVTFLPLLTEVQRGWFQACPFSPNLGAYLLHCLFPDIVMTYSSDQEGVLEIVSYRPCFIPTVALPLPGNVDTEQRKWVLSAIFFFISSLML